MEMFLDKSFDKDLRPLFTRDVQIENKELDKILDLPVDKLQGVDAKSREMLEKANITTVYELSQSILEQVSVDGIDATQLKKWIRKARIIVNYIQNPLTKRKLLLAGLDFAGKTSLLSVLKKDYSIIQDLLPTKGAQRDGVEFFGIPIITWDLGGQALYRKDYLDERKSKLYFSETDVVFYVIDVQDDNRYAESLEYYEQMLQAYESLEENPTIIVLFNKFDPEIRSESMLEAIARLQVKVADISTKYEFSPIFAKTTIYDKNSVFVAFSLGIRNISQTASLVASLLEEYTLKSNGQAAVLLSSEGEVFAQTGVTKEYIELVTQNGLLIDAMVKFNLGKGMKLEKNPVLKFSDNEKYLIGHHISSTMERTVYLWLLLQNLVDFTSSLNFFKSDVEPLLNLFII